VIPETIARDRSHLSGVLPGALFCGALKVHVSAP
jgi:hypothetical protein